MNATPSLISPRSYESSVLSTTPLSSSSLNSANFDDLESFTTSSSVEELLQARKKQKLEIEPANLFLIGMKLLQNSIIKTLAKSLLLNELTSSRIEMVFFFRLGLGRIQKHDHYKIEVYQGKILDESQASAHVDGDEVYLQGFEASSHRRSYEGSCGVFDARD
jgi:hypothetical protein